MHPGLPYFKVYCCCCVVVFSGRLYSTLIHHQFPQGRAMNKGFRTVLRLLFQILFNCFFPCPQSCSQRTPLTPPQTQPSMSNLCALGNTIPSAFPLFCSPNLTYCVRPSLCATSFRFSYIISLKYFRYKVRKE